jgi:hypothetical protein
MKNVLSKMTALFALIILLAQPVLAQTKDNNKDKNAIQQKFSVYFDVNQSKIKTNDYLVLDSVVKILSKGVNLRRIQINGYADTTGGAEANLELSNKRTDTVANYILGKGLMALKSKVATASLGEKVSGKEADLNEMRRVDVVIVMARPDRDTTIYNGCASVTIKANTFDGFNNDEVQFKLEYLSQAEEIKKLKWAFKDESGNNMLSNGIVKLTATYRGKALKPTKELYFRLPKINKESDYQLYKGVEDKAKGMSWKACNIAVDNTGSTCNNAQGNTVDLQAFASKDINQYLNVEKKWPSCYCSTDPFGGVQVPSSKDLLAKYGKDKSIVVLNDACYKKQDAASTYIQVLDDLYPNEFLNFCNSFMLPGVGKIPAIQKYSGELVKFIDFNVSQKNDTADMIMMKKNKILIMIPKSKFPAHEGKQYAILPAETKKDNFLNWTSKPVFNDACQGLANCDYWIFEAPFSGFYSLVELTPLEKGAKASEVVTDEEAEVGEEANGKHVKVKVKKYNGALLVWGAQDENKAQTAKFIANKGKNSILEPAINKSDKKQYKSHVFMAYKLVGGKRYAWIGKGSELKSNLFTGNWKTPKLQYVPDEEWENFCKKYCE